MGDDAENLKAATEGVVAGLMKPVQSITDALLLPSASEIGGLMGDYFHLVRKECLHKFRKKFKHVIDEAGFTPKEPPPKVTHEILGAATLEDSDEIQEIWANMLANAANPESPDVVAPSFPGMLKDLRPVDVKFLDALYSQFTDLMAPEHRPVERPRFLFKQMETALQAAGIAQAWQGKVESERLMAAIKHDRSELYFIIDSIKRAGILEEIKGVDDANLIAISEKTSESYYVMTELGVRFVEACRPPRKESR